MEVPSNSFTQVLRDQLFELVKEFDAVLKPGEGKKIIYLGTPQNEMSLYNELQERGYTAVIYPARYPYDDSHRASYGDRLAPIIADKYDKDPKHWAGKPTDPLRFSEEDLQKRELSYRKAGFALQFMLDTTLSDADKYPLRLRDLIVGMFPLDEAPMKLTWLPEPSKRVPVDECPTMGLKGDSYFYYHASSNEVVPYAHKILCVDPSGRGKDETGYSVLYYLNGYIYVMEVGGLLGGYSDVVLNKLAKVAKKYKVNEVVIEGNFGDGMYIKLFEPVLKKTYSNCGVTEVKSTGQKELRIIDTLEPVMVYKLQSLAERVKRLQMSYSELYNLIVAELTQAIVNKIVDLALVEGDGTNGFKSIDKEADVKKIKKITTKAKSAGKTPFADAIEEAVDFVRPTAGRRYLILKAEDRKALLDELRQATANANVRIKNDDAEIASEVGVDEIIVYTGTKAVKPTVLVDQKYHIDMQDITKVDAFEWKTNSNMILVETLTSGHVETYNAGAVITVS